MKDTPIQWCDSSVNPVMGCNGCELWDGERKTCYAGQGHRLRKNHKGFADDFLQPMLFPGRMEKAARYSDLVGKRRPDKPWLDGHRRLIFVSDMGDALSTNNVVDQDGRPVSRQQLFAYLEREIIRVALSENGRRHDWLWLTKRPATMARFARWLRDERGIDWPFNLWPGTSITSDDGSVMGRIDHLLDVGDSHTLRFLSLEPLWSDVDLAGRLDGIGWVIAGGESSQGDAALPFPVERARAVRDACNAANVPFFLKQLGARPTESGVPLKIFGDRHGGDYSKWPDDLRVRQVPIPQHLGAVLQ